MDTPKPTRRYLIGATILFTLAAFAVVGMINFDHKGVVALRNKSTQPITLATVEVYGQKMQFRDIAPNAQATGQYRVGADDHYRIKVQFASGKKLETEMGYVTSQLDYQDEITVSDQNIELTKTDATYRK